MAAAGVVGNVIEWYDFALYVYLATMFAGKFFPQEIPTSYRRTYGLCSFGRFSDPNSSLAI